MYRVSYIQSNGLADWNDFTEETTACSWFAARRSESSVIAIYLFQRTETDWEIVKAFAWNPN